jgi:hypothetical protein
MARSGSDHLSPHHNGKVQGTSACEFSSLEKSVHLCMNTPASFIVRTRRDVVVLSPAVIQFRAVRLLPGCPGVTRGYDRVVLIHDDGAEIAPQAGTLVCTPECKIEKILVPVGSH